MIIDSDVYDHIIEPNPLILPEIRHSHELGLILGESRDKEDDLITKLYLYINGQDCPEYSANAMYELAKAYELIKNDKEMAISVLKKMVTTFPDTDAAVIAKKRARYINAKQIHHNQQQELESDYRRANQRYERYCDTSWLVLPLKLIRWFGYLSANATANANAVRAKQTTLIYEAEKSPFAVPVDYVFDSFMPFFANDTQKSDAVLLYNNDDAWYARWKVIQEAKKSIDIKYYIIKPDIFGYAMLGALLEKARNGVNIRILLDARGSWRLLFRITGQGLLNTLNRYPNVEIRVYRPISRSIFTFLIDFREIMSSNHKKIILVDGQYSIIGGRNIAVEYFASEEDTKKAWRDCDILIYCDNIGGQIQSMFYEQFSIPRSVKLSKGRNTDNERARSKLTAAFDIMDSHMRRTAFDPYKNKNISTDYLEYSKAFLKETAVFESLSNFQHYDLFANSFRVPVKIMDSHSIGGYRNDITGELISYIDGAEKEIIIQNSYIVITRRKLNALKRAGRRGVSIIFLTNSPKSTDNIFTQAMFYSDWKKLLEVPGLQIFVFSEKNTMHAKNWIFDNKISIVGTYNMDYLGEQVNSEIVVAVKSREFSEFLRNEIMSDIAVSKEYRTETGEDGKTTVVFGPSDLPGSNFWLLRILSRLTAFRHLM